MDTPLPQEVRVGPKMKHTRLLKGLIRASDVAARTGGGFALLLDHLDPDSAIETGERIVREICQDCWGQWLRQQTMLINHYGLNLMDPQARTFLSRQRDAFLFKTDATEEVDTSKQGTINW